MTKSTRKAVTKPAARGSRTSVVNLPAEPGKSAESQFAEATTHGVVPLAAVLATYSGDTFSHETSVQDAYLELARLSDASTSGDLVHAERLLSAQMLALNAIFAGLAMRAKTNSQTGYLQASETYLKLALRAQAQSRQTAQTLFEMNNPRPVAFVQQANFSHGPQQVNNGVSPEGGTSRTRARENDSSPTKLLEQQHGEWLDTGTQGQAGRAHPQLATVGAIHGADDGSGQGNLRNEPLSRRQASRTACVRPSTSGGDAATGGMAGEVGRA